MSAFSTCDPRELDDQRWPLCHLPVNRFSQEPNLVLIESVLRLPDAALSDRPALLVKDHLSGLGIESGSP